MQLLARHVGARIHEEGGLPAAFQRELAELEHFAFNHELDELLLVLLHEGSLPSLSPRSRAPAANHDTRKRRPGQIVQHFLGLFSLQLHVIGNYG